MSPERAIRHWAGVEPGRLAIAEGERRLTYGELDEAVDRLADKFRVLGVLKGQVITIWMPAWWEASAIFNAALRVGAVPHALAHSVGDDEAAQILTVARPAVVLLGAENPNTVLRMADLVQSTVPGTPVLPIRPGTEAGGDRWTGRESTPRTIPGAAALIFTSGTTGGPKGVVHDRHSLNATCADIAERFEFTTESVIGMASPIGHVRWVLYGGMLPFLVGGTLLTAGRWNPAEWATAAAEVRCSFGAFSPKHVEDLIELLGRGLTVPSLRMLSCGGSYLPAALLQRAEELLGGRIVRSYGCTEFPSATASSPQESENLRWTFDGTALRGVEIELVEDDGGDGEEAVSLSASGAMKRIRLRGTHAAVGVLNGDTDEILRVTDPHGWLSTADFGEMDDGLLRVVGRRADMIIRNGENISATELEEVLGQHPLIDDVAVVGRRDPTVGERVCAVCVTHDGSRLEVADLTGFLAERHVAKWRWPESMMDIDAIPRTSSGKVRRGDLWQLVNANVPTVARSTTGQPSHSGDRS
jgi:cyclohexanecarboxylate-CoA ligase